MDKTADELFSLMGHTRSIIIILDLFHWFRWFRWFCWSQSQDQEHFLSRLHKIEMINY